MSRDGCARPASLAQQACSASKSQLPSTFSFLLTPIYSPDAEADLDQDLADAVGLLALDFDQVVFDGAARAAGVLQLSQDGGEVIAVGGESSDGGDELPFLPFLDRDLRRLVAGGDPLERGWGWRRADAFRLQLTTLLTARRTVERSSSKQTHAPHLTRQQTTIEPRQ